MRNRTRKGKGKEEFVVIDLIDIIKMIDMIDI